MTTTIIVAGRRVKIDGTEGYFYIANADFDDARYVQKDGKWHSTTGFDRGYWPTEAAAREFALAARSQPAEGADGLNLDHNEARALHRIVRAMHDGECPKCHKVHASKEMVYEEIRPVQMTTLEGRTIRPLSNVQTAWKCPSCGFAVTMEEADAVFQIFAPFMERNLAIFEQWRASRAPGERVVWGGDRAS